METETIQKLIESFKAATKNIETKFDTTHQAACRIVASLESKEYTVEEALDILEKCKSIIQRSTFKMLENNRISGPRKTISQKANCSKSSFNIDKFLLGKESELKQSMDEIISKFR